MTARIATWIRGRPVPAFYILAFALTWLAWVPQALHSHGLFPFDSPLFYVLGGVGPMLAALLVNRALRGEAGDGELLRPLLQWSVGAIWYVVAVFGYAAVWLVAAGIGGDLGAEAEALGLSLSLLPVFLVYLVQAVPEEVAWRGFVLPRLQRRHSALVASLMIGVLSALWHLPLLMNADNIMSTYPLAPYLLYVIALTVLYTWLFNSTRGSLLLLVLFHAASNTFGSFDLAEAAVVILLAAAVVIVFGPAHLSRRGGRVSVEDDVRPSAATSWTRGPVAAGVRGGHLINTRSHGHPSGCGAARSDR